MLSKELFARIVNKNNLHFKEEIGFLGNVGVEKIRPKIFRLLSTF
jgi:hypothetical protein